MHELRVIRFCELKKKVGASRSTIFRWERDGRFPKHFKLGENSIGWIQADIEEWLLTRAGITTEKKDGGNNHAE